jgi:hypothetical protein
MVFSSLLEHFLQVEAVDHAKKQDFWHSPSQKTLLTHHNYNTDAATCQLFFCKKGRQTIDFFITKGGCPDIPL